MRANALALFGYSSMQAAEGDTEPTIIAIWRINIIAAEAQKVSIINTGVRLWRPIVTVLAEIP